MDLVKNRLRSVLDSGSLNSLLMTNLNGPPCELFLLQCVINCWCIYISTEEMGRGEFVLASRAWKIFAIPDYVCKKEAFVADRDVMLV
jgi:hypothetical protein